MSNLIQVMYQVPVACLVDVEAGEIRAVCALDEDIELQPGVFCDDRGEVVAPNDETARAEEIADHGESFWPNWQFGY